MCILCCGDFNFLWGCTFALFPGMNNECLIWGRRLVSPAKKKLIIMSLKYRTVKRKVLAGQEKDQVKTYGVAKSSYYCDMWKLCELVASRSAMSSGDVKSILDSLNWVIDLELRSGAIVQVGELGNFRMSLSSKGAADGEKFTADMIKKARIVFTPGSILRSTSLNASFESDDVKTVTEECDKPHLE